METFKFIALFMCIGAVNTVDIFVKVRFRGGAVMTSYSDEETITAKNEQELREKLTETLEKALLDKQIEEVTIETDIYHGNKVHSTQVTKFDVTTMDGLDDTTLVTTTKSDDITKAVTPSAARSSSRTGKDDDATTATVLESVITTPSMISVAFTDQKSTLTSTTDVPSTTVPYGLEYDGKRFVPLKKRKTNKAQAESRCKEIGGKLANIYNDDHMDKILDFIRLNMKADYINFHLGMTYDSKAHTVILSNQTKVSESKYRWRKDFPSGDGKLLYLRVNGVRSKTNQYLWNGEDLDKYVLCEVPH
ncbi:uncharacterized protein LOC144429964 [Styela clava]